MKARTVAAALVVVSLALVSMIVAPIWAAGSSGTSTSSLPLTPAGVPVPQAGLNPNTQVGIPPCPPGDACQFEYKTTDSSVGAVPTEQPEAPAAPQQSWVPLTEEGLLPRPEPDMGATWQDPARLITAVQGGAAPTASIPQDVGGPDDFGYTWDDSGVFVWIDAAAGGDTGLSQAPWGASVTSPISVGFPFKFYENTYSSLYISTAGAAGFDGSNLVGRTGTSWVPSADTPNNFIAPYLAPLWVNSGSYSGRVYYLRGGSAPDRYLVVEWYQVQDDLNGQFTFEVILYENGNIAFSYQSMVHGDGYYCRHDGSHRRAGPATTGWPYRASDCNGMNSTTGKTVLFTRPAATPRVGIFLRRTRAALPGGGHRSFPVHRPQQRRVWRRYVRLDPRFFVLAYPTLCGRRQHGAVRYGR